ncbi:MAG: glycosyltransferase [Anaerolineales bacterium]
MRLLVLSHEFPPIGGGGGRVARDLACGLAARGHEVTILSAGMAGLPGEENLGGARLIRLAAWRKNAFAASLAEMAHFDQLAVRQGRRLLAEWRPDVIHAHFAVPAGAAAFALSRLSGIPYVLTAHLGDVPGAVPEKTEAWFRLFYPFTPPIWNNAARVIAVSEFTRALAQKRYRAPMTVIPNGVDFSALPPRLPKNEIPRLVFAGRFVETKNPGHLVQALARLRSLPWQATLLGDGPLLEPVRRQVAESGLAERIALPGWVTPEEVLTEFSRSDILALPSRAEGLSVVGVQALAMGLALVLGAAGGNLELVEDGQNGFLFPPGDVDALTAALRRLLADSAALQSAQSHSLTLAQKFDLNAIVAQYEALLSVVGGR